MVWLIRKRPTYMGLRSRIWTSGWSDAGMPGFMKIGFWKTGYFVIVLHTDTDILTWAKIQDPQDFGTFKSSLAICPNLAVPDPQLCICMNTISGANSGRLCAYLAARCFKDWKDHGWLATGPQGSRVHQVWQWTWRLTPFNTTTEWQFNGENDDKPFRGTLFFRQTQVAMGIDADGLHFEKEWSHSIRNIHQFYTPILRNFEVSLFCGNFELGKILQSNSPFLCSSHWPSHMFHTEADEAVGWS